MNLCDLIKKRYEPVSTATPATFATVGEEKHSTIAMIARIAVANTHEDLKREERRQRVLSVLAKRPDTQLAIITDLESDFDNVILSMVIRNVATFEMIIPREKYDASLVSELIKKIQIKKANKAICRD